MDKQDQVLEDIYRRSIKSKRRVEFLLEQNRKNFKYLGRFNRTLSQMYGPRSTKFKEPPIQETYISPEEEEEEEKDN